MPPPPPGIDPRFLRYYCYWQPVYMPMYYAVYQKEPSPKDLNPVEKTKISSSVEVSVPAIPISANFE